MCNFSRWFFVFRKILAISVWYLVQKGTKKSSDGSTSWATSTDNYLKILSSFHWYLSMITPSIFIKSKQTMLSWPRRRHTLLASFICVNKLLQLFYQDVLLTWTCVEASRLWPKPSKWFECLVLYWLWSSKDGGRLAANEWKHWVKMHFQCEYPITFMPRIKYL